MLVALELSNFAIVDELRVAFEPGLNVLSGETGAGKSILIDALTLLMGGRGDSSFIRSGEESALIQGVFEGGARESAARRLQANGRSAARLDGELVTVGELAENGSRLVAIHGQHASQTLLDSGEQRKLLDRLLDEDAQRALARYREQFSAYQNVIRELEQLREAARERARRLDMLHFQIQEIDAAKLKPGEEAPLEAKAERLRHAERIVQSAGKSVDVLSEADVNAVDLAAEALRELELAGRYEGGLATLAEELSEALTGLQAVAAEVSSFLADFEADPGELDRVERRLDKLESLKLKYGDSLGAVLQFREQAGQELARLEHVEADLEALEQQQGELERQLRADAEILTAARQGAATTLAQQVEAHVTSLGMPNARFMVEVSAHDDRLGAHGLDKVRFLFSANLGEPPAPLSDVASGGELSRLMLALNVVTGSDVPTLAFDEVDAGIGGQAARAVGALLKALAAQHQVLVVTHLPQVAAFADAHFYVEKLEREGRTVTQVRRLAPQERSAELARMLSGSVTDTALAHARELLSEAAGR